MIVNNKGVLSIDIGGTSITAAVIKPSMSYDQLKDLHTVKFRSLGWINETLPEIIISDEVNQFEGTYDKAVISGPFVLNNEKNIIDPTDYYVKSKKVPFNLPEKISELIDKPVTIENDAVAWMRGNIRFQKLNSNKIEFPALTLCLGTGVGLAVAKDEVNIMEYNIGKSYSGSDFPALTKTAGYYFLKDQTANKVHAILGDRFINWVKKKRSDWDYKRIKSEFTKRLIAMLDDIESHGPLKNHEIKTLFICGGNSKYVDESMLEIENSIDIIYHRNDSIEINPDIIPLLGNIEEADLA